MRALIIGGTGRVGQHVMLHLSTAGVEAVAASRHPVDGGIKLDLTVPNTIQAATKGFDVAFLVTPLGPDESAIGVAAVTELRAAGIGKIVYLSIMNLEAMRAIPHFETKIPIKAAVLADHQSVVLEANFFFQNDALMLPAMLHGGVYPLPVGSTGVWSIDAGDIGRAAARAMVQNDWNGQAVPVCGADLLTGPSMAATWSAALGRPVVYPGDDIAPFIFMLSKHIPGWNPWIAHDFQMMMQVTQCHGCPATEVQRAQSFAIIGQPLRTYADFVRDLSHTTLTTPKGDHP